MSVGEVKPGYELWRPNREKPESITTKIIVVALLLISAVLISLVTIGGWPLLRGGLSMGIICMIFAILDLAFAYAVSKWTRGVLPVVAAFAILLVIFCAVAVPTWFGRDKVGFEEALIPTPMLGLLTALLIPIQIFLMIAAVFAFNQEWHVEEERPIGSGSDYGAGASPAEGDVPPLPA